MRLSAPILAATAVVAAVTLTACGSDSDTDGAAATARTVEVTPLSTAPMEAARAKAIDAAARALVDRSEGQVPAVWVGVWDPDDGAHTFAYGEAAPGRPATVDDVWRIGSITKTFTATVVLELVDEGEIALSDTVADVDPDLATRFPAYAGLTIRQLLGMRSGIADYLNGPTGIVGDITEDPQRVWAPNELVAAGVAVGVSAPGTPGYSTTNYIVLQEIAEHVGGAPLRTLIAERVTGPLGLATTLLPPDEDTALSDPTTTGTLAAGCVKEVREDGGTARVGEDVTDWNVSYGQGGGGMQSSLEELGRWAASGSGSALLDPATATARARTRPVQPGLRYGLGLQQVGDMLGHEGEVFGWEALELHDPVKGGTVVVAANACGVGFELYELADIAFPDAGITESLFD